MAISTGLAIGIAAAASAGAQTYAAHQASKASKEAAKIQSEGARRAQSMVDSALLPYVNKGREVISTLGRLTAAPPGARFAAPDPTLGQMKSPNQAVPRGTIGSIGVAEGGMRPSMAAPRAAVGTIGSIGMPQFVQMRAPTGEIAAIPAHRVAEAERLGAVRLA